MIMDTLLYIKQRLKERSTWVAISGAVGAASILTPPMSYIALIAGIVAALIPDGEIKKSAIDSDPQG